MDKTIEVTVIVITYNRAARLAGALDSLLHQETDGDLDFEILVVDDGSTDQTAALVQDLARTISRPSLRYVRQDNAGIASARNLGVAKARGSWLAFFDDDQVASPRWLVELYRTAQEQGLQCVGGPVTLKLPESASFAPGPKTRGILGEKLMSGLGRRSPKNVFGSGNILVHRSLVQKVGGFDPAMPKGSDTDFFWKIDKIGASMGVAPLALIYHVIPESRLQMSYLRRLCFKTGVSSADIQLKHEGSGRVALAALTRVGVAYLRDLPLIAYYTLKGNRPLRLDYRTSLWFTSGFFQSCFSWCGQKLLRLLTFGKFGRNERNDSAG